MHFPVSFFHRSRQDKNATQNFFVNVFGMIRNRLVFVGVCGLALMLASILLFDGLVFYTTVLQPREPAAGSKKKISISEKEITDARDLLTARQKEFDQIVNNFGASLSASSSAAVQERQ